jgi:glycine cleavage system regulatory protein
VINLTFITKDYGIVRISLNKCHTLVVGCKHTNEKRIEMATFTVYLTANISDSIEVDADDLYEAQEIAIKSFESTWLPLNQDGGYTHVWDNIDIDSVDEVD